MRTKFTVTAVLLCLADKPRRAPLLLHRTQSFASLNLITRF